MQTVGCNYIETPLLMKSLKKYIFTISYFIIAACNSNNSSKTGIYKTEKDSLIEYKAKSDEILKIMKEGSNFLIQGMELDMKMHDSITSKIYYRKALDKFLIALAVDTTRKKVGIYIPDLYVKLKMFDSASYWKNWLGPEDKQNF